MPVIAVVIDPKKLMACLHAGMQMHECLVPWGARSRPDTKSFEINELQYRKHSFKGIFRRLRASFAGSLHACAQALAHPRTAFVLNA
jgi:hypothetical protein